MEKVFWQKIEESLIFVDLEAGSTDEIFEKMGGALIRSGKCKASYIDALKEREDVFPTGIMVQDIGVAIPHTDIVHNLAEKVVVVRLDKPVTFHNMIAPDKEVEVSLLFFIINNSSSSQTNILAQLMDFFTGNSHLEDLSKISEPEALYAYIAEAIA